VPWSLSGLVTIVTRLFAEQPAFDSHQGMEFFPLATMSKPALGPTQPPVQCVLGPKAHHSSPTSAKVKSSWSSTSAPPIHIHGMVLNYAMNVPSWHGT